VYVKDLSIRTLEPARTIICGSAVLPAFELGVLAVEFDTILVRAIRGREVRVFGSGFVVGEGKDVLVGTVRGEGWGVEDGYE